MNECSARRRPPAMLLFDFSTTKGKAWIHVVMKRPAFLFSIIVMVMPQMSHASADNPSEKFMYAVCELRKNEKGNITFGSGEGCSWQGSNMPNAIQESEYVRFMALRGVPEETLKLNYDILAKSFAEAVKESEGLAVISDINPCGKGGLSIRMPRIKDKPPSAGAIYFCKGSFVTLFVGGDYSIKEFEILVPKIAPLLEIE